MKLLVATSNPGKLIEIREILAGLPLDLVSLQDAALPAPEETGSTFHENAAQKATTCARQSGLWTLADDSGLCVEALAGAPGVHSARYAATEQDRRAKLLAALEGVPEGRRGAHFFCAVALSPPDGTRVLRAEGRVEEMKAIESRITGAAAQKAEEETARFKGIITMYEGMKPKDAAKVFDRLEMPVLFDIASQIAPRKMADILGQMSPEVAERLTVEMARRAGSDKSGSAVDLPKIEGRMVQPQKAN